MCQFERAIGIDYSGAKTADNPLSGLRVYESRGQRPATERRPTPNEQVDWTRRGLTEWLKAELEKQEESIPTIVGIDHAFSFPQPYFETYDLPYCWNCFLDDFCRHWPTDRTDVSPVGLHKSGDPTVEARLGRKGWFRHTEMNSPAKSVFNFETRGQVAASTHAGLPFLRELRRALPNVHFWPFDGWEIQLGHSCIVEAYPSLYREYYEEDSSLTNDQRDAYVTAMWMHDADRDGRLKDALNPALPDRVRTIAKYEGWILGATW